MLVHNSIGDAYCMRREAMKRKIKYVIISIFVILAGVLAYINLFSPVFLGKKYIVLDELFDSPSSGDVYDLESYKKDIETGKSGGRGMQAVRTSDKMPSYDTDDYMTFSIFIDITNISFFEQRGFDIYFETSEDARIIDKASCEVTEWIKSGRKKTVWAVSGDIYSKGLDKEELVDYISNQKVKLVVHNDFLEDITMNIDLKGAVLEKHVKWGDE